MQSYGKRQSECVGQYLFFFTLSCFTHKVAANESILQTVQLEMDILNQISHLKRLNLKEQSKLMQLPGYLKEKNIKFTFPVH